MSDNSPDLETKPSASKNLVNVNAKSQTKNEKLEKELGI